MGAPSSRPPTARCGRVPPTAGQSESDLVAARSPSPRARPDHHEETAQALAELYLQARAIVERHYRRPLTLPLVARTLATSPRQLQRAYEEIGLTTFAANLRRVRMRNAAELLAHQPLTVTDVAQLVGYRQPSHFVKAFRRRYGTTPGTFRDRARRSRDREGRAAVSPSGATASSLWRPPTPPPPPQRHQPQDP